MRPSGLSKSPGRATSTSAIRASRRGGRWLFIFLVGVAVLLLSAAFLLWPTVSITIEPSLEQVTLAGSVLIDSEVQTFIPASGVVPGRTIAPGTSVLPGERVVTVGSHSYVYQAGSANAVVASAVATNLGTDYHAVEPWGEVQWGKPRLGSSGSIVSLPFTIGLQRYHRFPVADWRKYVRGIPIGEAERWLAAQPGVAQAKIALYPSFFAKISQKMPTNGSLIRFSLDIAQETSILE